MHGTLEMIPLAWKFNSKKLLCKTLNSRMNIIETRAVLKLSKRPESETRVVLNIARKDGIYALEAKQEDLEKSTIYQNPSQSMEIIFHFENVRLK